MQRMVEWLLLVVMISVVFGCGSSNDVLTVQDQEEVRGAASGYSWMTMLLPWRGELKGGLFSKEHSKESEEPAVDISSSSGYTLYLALGSAEYRVYNVVEISSTGEMTAAYKDPNNYRYYQKKYKLSSQQLAGLREILIQNKAGAMLASSVNDEATGGVQGGFTLTVHNKTRRSYFSNSWPKQFRRIMDYVNDDILCFDPQKPDNGFVEVRESIITADPEATLAIRGLLKGR